MNNCHKIVLSLSQDELRQMLQCDLLKSERKLLLYYARTTSSVPIRKVGEKLGIHAIHVSRLNSSLYDKVFAELRYHGTDKELDLLLKSGLYKYLFIEISRRISLIVYIQDTSMQIKQFHTYLSYIFEVPYSRMMESFFLEVIKKMNSIITDMPIGHKEAIELTALWINIAVRHVYTQKTDSILSSHSKSILRRLIEYEDNLELRNNQFFLERLYNAFAAYHNIISKDLLLSDEYMLKSYKANLLMDQYPYPFNPKSTLGVVRRRFYYLFNLSMFAEYIDLFRSLSEEQKQEYFISIVPRTFTSVIVSYISLGRVGQAHEVFEWYQNCIETLESPSIEQKIILLHTRTIVQMHSDDYVSALDTIVEIAKLNKHPNYNLGLEAINRIYECECRMLLKEWKTAYLTIGRTIKWYERNADSYMKQDIEILKGFLDGLDYRTTRSGRSKKRWEALLDSHRTKKDLYGAEHTINKLSHLFGFSEDLDILPVHVYIRN